MPWGATFDVPAPIETYDETIPLVEEITHGMPEGMIIHVASPTDSGYRVTEVWQSEEHWKRFRTGVLYSPATTAYRAGRTGTTRSATLPGARSQVQIHRDVKRHDMGSSPHPLRRLVGERTAGMVGSCTRSERSSTVDPGC
jgi:hypothetical protein